MPLHRRLPKRGFNNIFAKDYNEVGLGRVQQAIDAGKLDARQPVTVEALKAAGVVRRASDGVRLLGQRRTDGGGGVRGQPGHRSSGERGGRKGRRLGEDRWARRPNAAE